MQKSQELYRFRDRRKKLQESVSKKVVKLIVFNTFYDDDDDVMMMMNKITKTKTLDFSRKMSFSYKI